MISQIKYIKNVLRKRLIELVLIVFVIIFIINCTIFFSFLAKGENFYGKGELGQDDNGNWYVYVYGFNEVYIDNSERFADILKSQI